MKTKKQVSVNNIFSKLLLNNIIPILLIVIVSIAISFYYNSIKTNSYNYSISIEKKKSWISNRIYQSLNYDFLDTVVVEYLTNTSKKIQKKQIQNGKNGELIVTIKSYERLDLNNFLNMINNNAKDLIYIKLKTELSELENSLKMKDYKNDYSEFFKDIEDISDVAQILKIEQFIATYDKAMTTDIKLINQIKNLKNYKDNFKQILKDDLYYSLNGWSSKDNDFDTTDKIVSGLIFAILLSSLYLFFKSDYYRRFLKN